jgi:hypothetical protein
MPENSKTILPTSGEEIGRLLPELFKQCKTDPDLAGIMCVYGGKDPNVENALTCGHVLHNPHTIATILTNEAIMFSRHDDVLRFVHDVKQIMELVEENIHHHLRIQSKQN